MKILLIAHKMSFPPRGGSTLRMFNLIKESSKNHELHLITFTQESYLIEDPRKLKESIKTLKKYCKEVQVFRVKADDNPKSNKRAC